MKVFPLRASAENKSTLERFFLTVCFVPVDDTYLDMHRRLRRADDPESGLIRWIYF